MCAHPRETRRARTVKVRGYVVTTHFCPLCWREQQRARRAKARGEHIGINKFWDCFARLPVIT